MTPEEFIERWRPSGGSEQANAKLFLPELADLIGAPRPDPSVQRLSSNDYVFERRIVLRADDANRYIDLYKRDCFVLEAKQSRHPNGQKRSQLDPVSGGEPERNLFGEAIKDHLGHGLRDGPQWAKVMRSARQQAEGYVRNLPDSHKAPPFIIICDVGHMLELWSNFAGDSKAYTQFPDRSGYRIRLDDLAKPEVRDLLKAVWTDPMSLDPARKSAEVTNDVAERLARVAKELEKTHEPERVAMFLMRCLFTMFAEDVGLLPNLSFTKFLKQQIETPDRAHLALQALWKEMDTGGFAGGLNEKVRRFNGGLFRNADALPLTADMIGELYQAARRDWRDVEPAIFGTLLEQALNPRERSKLGAHYTPRPYVERLVIPTIIDPLREDWAGVQAECELLIQRAAEKTDRKERQKEEAKAVAVARDFHGQLCTTDILDPACGTGNFLYVAFEHMKRLEGEVLDFIASLPGVDENLRLELGGVTVDPRHFLGIEVNPRAKEIAELVLWIGYLKWQLKTGGQDYVRDPVLEDFHNIVCRDAILEWDGDPVLRRGPDGRPVTRWDGLGQRPNPMGEGFLPDETARVEVYDYTNPRPASWPKADFIIGNPPFIAGSSMRGSLGDSYAEGVWNAYPHMPRGADFVLYWWDKAAELVSDGATRQFGFITTKAIAQVYGRSVLARHISRKRNRISLLFAVPNHPWIKGADRAAVRIAMTVGAKGEAIGELAEVKGEYDLDSDTPRIAADSRSGRISPSLRLGADVGGVGKLGSNEKICHDGVKLHGKGFLVSPAKARALGFGQAEGLDNYIKTYRNGRDVAHTPRGLLVIDLFGLEKETVRQRFPLVYQHLDQTVRSARQAVFDRSGSRDAAEYLSKWWLFGKPREELRPALKEIGRWIGTVDTAEHRVFQFFPKDWVCDDKIVYIASEAAWHLSVLSSRFHIEWSTAAGGRLGAGNQCVYVKSRCFDPFPFPELTGPQKQRLDELGEGLDAHRKRVIEEQTDATLTKMYNVLERVRAIETAARVAAAADAHAEIEPPPPLSDVERDQYERWQVGVLKSYHDDIDAAVAEAYGWPGDHSDDEILERLVALNLERAAEERRGKVRWLRPEFQNPDNKTLAAVAEQMEAELESAEKAAKPAFPKETRERARALLSVVSEAPEDADRLASNFRNAKRETVREILDVLVEGGRIVATDDGRYFRAA